MKPRDLAGRLRDNGNRLRSDDGYKRERFSLPREKARQAAREFLAKYPKEAYMSEVETWREAPGDMIEFTMRRLATSD